MTLPRRANLGRPDRLRARLDDSLALVPDTQPFAVLFADDFSRSTNGFQALAAERPWAAMTGATDGSNGASLRVVQGYLSCQAGAGDYYAAKQAGADPVEAHYVEAIINYSYGSSGFFACGRNFSNSKVVLIDISGTNTLRVRTPDSGLYKTYAGVAYGYRYRFWRDGEGKGNIAYSTNAVDWINLEIGIALPNGLGNEGGLWANNGDSGQGGNYLDNFVYGAV